MGLVLVLCFSVAPISPSILLCFLLGGIGYFLVAILPDRRAGQQIVPDELPDL